MKLQTILHYLESFFINLSEPERIQILVRFLQKNGAKGKK